eukprot:1187350-Prorocentrum_minimum.AAC.1
MLGRGGLMLGRGGFTLGGVVWSSEDAESGPQHRLQTANQGVQYVKGVHGLPDDNQLPMIVTFNISTS